MLLLSIIMISSVKQAFLTSVDLLYLLSWISAEDSAECEAKSELQHMFLKRCSSSADVNILVTWTSWDPWL